MSNELILDEKTGFMYSPSTAHATFDIERKINFLKVAHDYKKKTGMMPDFGSVCEQIGITLQTFYNHLKHDAKFRHEWDELMLKGEASLEAKMYAKAEKNPIYMFGWLRRHFPDRWNPEHKITVEHSNVSLEDLANKAKRILTEEGKLIEAEVVSDSERALPERGLPERGLPERGLPERGLPGKD